MSGHSKWSTIKHQKAAADSKRGKLFSKIAKEITVAARAGGSPDPNINPRLRLIIDKARGANMPKENIKRAIDKGAGRGEDSQLETVIYEGFGPENISLMVECLTDNRNRCNQEIKAYFDKNGGRLGSTGAVSYLFDKKGLVLVEKEANEEEQSLKLIDCGIQDLETREEGILVYTEPEALHDIVAQIEKAGFKVKEADLGYRPKSYKEIEDARKKERIEEFLRGLDELDDVQNIYLDLKI